MLEADLATADANVGGAATAVDACGFAAGLAFAVVDADDAVVTFSRSALNSATDRPSLDATEDAVSCGTASFVKIVCPPPVDVATGTLFLFCFVALSLVV